MIDFTRLKQRLHSDGPKGLFLFIVLLGILPAIEDFSLFAVFGFSITKFHVHEEFRLLYSIPLYLIPIALLLVMYGRSYSRILGLLPAFFAGYVHLIGTSENVSLEHYEALIGILHFACYKIAFLYFIKEGKLRSLPFVLILIVIWILLDIQHLILFLTYTILVRFLYLALKQNISIFKETGMKRTLFLMAKSFLYWSPLLIFIIPGAIISSKANKAAIDQIYDHTFMESTDQSRKYKRDQFEKDLEYSLEAEMICMKEAVENGTGRMYTIVKSKTEKLDEEVGDVYKGVFKPKLTDIAPFFKDEDCGFWGKLNFPCQAKNSAKETVRDTYSEQRRLMLSGLTEMVRNSANSTEEEIRQSTEQINAAINQEIDGAIGSHEIYSAI